MFPPFVSCRVVRAFCHAWHALVLKLTRKSHRSNSSLADVFTAFLWSKIGDGMAGVLQNLWENDHGDRSRMTNGLGGLRDLLGTAWWLLYWLLYLWIWFKYHRVSVDGMSAVCWHMFTNVLQSVYKYTYIYIYIEILYYIYILCR